MRPRVIGAALSCASAALFALAATAEGQRGPTAPIPAARPIGPVMARSSRTFASASNIRSAGGAVFIQDATARQLWMLDSSLANGRPVLDSTSGLGKESFYGTEGRGGRLYRFRGDSILYQATIATSPTSWGPAPEGLVISSSGHVGRVVAMPTTAAGCAPGEVENSGFFTCATNLALTWLPSVEMGDSVISKGRSDSAMMVSVNFTTGEVDTLGIRITTAPRNQLGIAYTNRSGSRSAVELPVVHHQDVWATFRDGTLAIARSADYHLDLYDVRGQVTHGPRAPFAWRRITDDDRDRLLDSLRRADSVALRRADSVAASRGPRVMPDGTVLPAAAQSLARGLASHAPPDEWATYWPPFKTSNVARAIMADEDGRLWVNERQPSGGDTVSVYGIFDRKGQFLERVTVPGSETVVAFGPGGRVYLTTVDGGRTTILARKFTR